VILLAYILIPSAAAPIAWWLGRKHVALARWTAVVATAAPLALAAVDWARHVSELSYAPPTPPTGSGLAAGDLTQWLETVHATWIPQLGISFFLAADGLTLILLVLTFGLGLCAVLASWRAVTERVGFFHFMLLWTTAAMAGVFMALDLFLFYFFFEMMLVPMYFIIAIWGYERRIYSAIKFFIFTQVSGLLMLVAILALYFIHGRSTGIYTFDFTQLVGTKMATATAFWLMLGFFAAFAVKLPAFPVHTWLPDAHTEAPTAGSVILAGVLIKIGAYGMLRFMVPLFPWAALHDFRTWGMILAIVGIIYGAVLAYAQTDLKRLVAYTSVSHMGFVLLGIFAWTPLALTGVVLEVVCHAFSTGALFLLVGAMMERMHTRDMERMGGLWGVVPRMGGTGLFFALASLGLPGLGNFVAEFLILTGTWQVARWAAVLGAIGLVFATVYALWMVQRAFQGKETHGWRFADLGPREIGMFAAFIAVLVFLGFYPQPIIRTAHTPTLVATVQAEYSAAVNDAVLPTIKEWQTPVGQSEAQAVGAAETLVDTKTQAGEE
jgi:NADH-quinone oxidoreductase subunit M